MVLNFGVLRFGWPNQPSSGTMRIYIGRCVHVDHDSFVAPEKHKTKKKLPWPFVLSLCWRRFFSMRISCMSCPFITFIVIGLVCKIKYLYLWFGEKENTITNEMIF